MENASLGVGSMEHPIHPHEHEHEHTHAHAGPGQTVLITGAAGGIGRATVALFAECGWNVIGVDRATFGDGFPEHGLFIQSDISKPEAMFSIFGKARQLTETLDAMGHNADLHVDKPLNETTIEEWDEVMAATLQSV